MDEFNPQPIFNLVAHDLVLRFGENALNIADRATDKMDKMANHEGAAMWRSVRLALIRLNTNVACTATLH